MANINYSEEDITGKAYDFKLMKRLLSFAKSYWRYFVIALIMLVASTISNLSRPYLVKIAIDDYLNGYVKPMIAYPKSSGQEGINFEDRVYKRVDSIPKDVADDRIYSLVYIKNSPYLVNGLINHEKKTNAKIIENASGNNTFKYSYIQNGKPFPAKKLTKEEIRQFRSIDMRSIGTLGMIYILVVLAGFGFQYLEIYVLSFTGQSIIYDIRQKVFSHLQKMSLSFFDKNPVGRLVTRVSNDTEALNDMYTNVLINLFRDTFIIIGALAIMFRMNTGLAVVALAVMPVVVMVTVVFRIKARAVYRKVRVNLARINATLSENLSGMRIIQIFNREKEKLDEFKKINKEYYKSGISEIIISGIFRPAIELISALTVALIIWYGGGKAIEGVLQFGVLYAFIQYIEYFFHPINDLSEKYNILQSAMASSERIFMILDTPVEEDEGKHELKGENLGLGVEFKNVWFAYEDENWVLRDVSFKVPAGKTVAIVGATGAGKTSIINILNRFYEIQKGEITINGVNILDIKKDSLRRSIGVVLQDVFIFSGTIKDNIRLNESSIADTDIIKASEYVNASSFINRLPNGYDNEVRERGETFSSGQRQLLAFARALAFDPPILVLDEATANIDTETERLIQDALTRLTRNRTTLVIAHRLSTIQHADNIIVMHKGKVREIGTHQQLLAKKGMYYNLYQLQYKGM